MNLFAAHAVRTTLVLVVLIMPAVAQENAALWFSALDQARKTLQETSEEQRPAAATGIWQTLDKAEPLYTDWLLQDAFYGQLWAHVPAGGRQDFRLQGELIGGKLADLLTGLDVSHWRALALRVLGANRQAGIPSDEIAIPPLEAPGQTWADCYLQACRARRAYRLKPLVKQEWPGIVFACHFNMGASHYAYTEGLSDAQNERHFYPGAALKLLRFEHDGRMTETLLEDAAGVIRDVDVSWDGRKILFSWKKSDREDDYSLYEMDAVTRAITPITGDLGHADYEAVYLPDGNILFNSTRCVQTVDCWWTEVSNLYTCGPDGRYLRRLTFDQVHTNYPTVTDDGRILYTRWDYNDRGQLYPQGLFEMRPDGTAQQEYYGNNSWFPTTILHARSIPGTTKVLAIFTGHHSWQAGKPGILDIAQGRQENEGAALVAPVRKTPAERIDSYGQEGDLFKYPYPVDERHFLVSYAPRGWEGRGVSTQMLLPVFGLYFMNLDGERELLFLDTGQGRSVGRMVPLAARSAPAMQPSSVDYTKATGVYYIQDIYAGQGLEGVPRGSVKSVRVVALDYRAAGIGNNRNSGIAGAALVSTPIAIENGSWDVKIPLGRARVHEDGSALFEVPARTPVYFQALDDKGRSIQSMRSWSTLQPGESRSCVGCHDDKNATPPAERTPTLAMRAGVQALETTDGPARGFSFNERIQPILDRHCIQCHHGAEAAAPDAKAAFSLMNTPRKDEEAKRFWSEAYLNLTESGPEKGPVRWISPQSAPPLYPPYYTGAVRSSLIEMLEEGHQEVRLTAEELEILACWIDLAVPFCGEYTEAHAWTEEEQARYAHFLKKRSDMEAVEGDNIRDLIEHIR